MSIYSQIHRYLIYLSFLFLFLSSAHLSWLYIGGDAKVRPVVGGTVSIGMIGNAPSLFPSEYGTDVNQDILLNLLYR
jgi:hypothetical protein